MNKNLLIIGEGQLGQIAKEIAETMNYFDKIDFLDDYNENAVGMLSDYESLSVDYSYAFAAIEDSTLRLKWIQMLEESCYKIATLVHSTAAVSPSAQINIGSIIGAHAIINTASVIAIGCIVSVGVIVDHDSFIGDGCFLDCGTIIKSNSILFSCTNVDCGAVSKGNVFVRCPDNYSFDIGV
ncbi:MAG: PglD-related sugar-binding protein [Eubacteriales bacterium]